MARQKKIKKLTDEELISRFKGRMIIFRDGMAEYRGVMLGICEDGNVTVSHRDTRYSVPKQNIRWV
jgi:hypothetical protein